MTTNAETMVDPLEMLLDAARFIESEKPGWAKSARDAVAQARASAPPAAVREALEATLPILSDRAAGGRMITSKEQAGATFALVKTALASLPQEQEDSPADAPAGAVITDKMVKAGAAAMCCQAQTLGCAAKNKDSEFQTCMLSTFMEDARRCLTAAVQAPGNVVEGVGRELQFLLDRLDEYDPGEADHEREFHGHIAPAIARLRSALARPERGTGA